VSLTSQHLVEEGQATLSAGDFERGQTALTSVVEIELGDAPASTGGTPRAIDECRRALEQYKRVGAPRGTDGAAALLRQLGAPNAAASRSAPGSSGPRA
jgi:hypothetical protein